MLNYTLGIQDSVRKIFAGVLVGAMKKTTPNIEEMLRVTKINRNRFIANFPSNIFQDEYAIFYEIFMTLNARNFSLKQLDTIIDNNRDLILNSPYVDTSSYSNTQSGTKATDDEVIEAMKKNLSDTYVELSNMYISEDEFESSCAIYIDWFKNNFMLQVAQSMSLIMSDQGCDIKKPNKRVRHYIGFDDCKEYYNESIKILNELSQKDKLRTLVLDNEWLDKDSQDEKIEDGNVLMTIGLSEIDNAIGDFRRGNMLGILGPPKGGKTRFTNYLVSRALSLGLNVCVWTLEGTKEEWISMQIAALIKREEGVTFNSKDILQRKYTTNPKDKETVTSAKMRLSLDRSYGRLSFIESTAYVEDFLSIIESHYENENPFDVIVIDQLIDILSRKGLGKVERISQAYQELKSFISTGMRRPALAIIPAQLKQSTVDFLRKNPDETIDVTAGGESAETIRTPDDVIGLFSSKQERAVNQMHFYSVASRHSGTFPDFQARADLQCCFFCSDASLNT